MGRRTYSLYGWYDGESDCEPPEPDKRWMTIFEVGDDDEAEVATFVQRKRDGVYRDDDTKRVTEYAERVLAALRLAEER